MDQSLGFMTSAPSVRVQRNGNSRVLPIPADLARRAHADLRDIYDVELVGEDIIYRRHGAHQVSTQGTGGGRIGMIPTSAVTPAPQRSSVPPLDWDF
ncbi:AbrB/MazE/SpoVT family DNA-binding domain-containing protein [Nocardioides abyssi]|uniref:AbrB/MazE/SpoVT family DNA-binding domain-containing protein n=1 Tax=Nocardioides abyssi TaxID=3058370 RepID=A0ABT8ESU6_9ACTN|nr:hypothetical protein [Nocardioides abyssi]MDN4161081.1 hypothetical protein [Nocardioides abyssi]